MERISWRDAYKVHPAADALPMLSEQELRELGEDIKKNGLQFRKVGLCSRSIPDANGVVDLHRREEFVWDGRNRLTAMELVGMKVMHEGKLNPDYFEFEDCEHDEIAARVIALNIRRRHLKKEDLADWIVAVVKAEHLANGGEVPKRHVKGKAGSEKDPVKDKAVAEGKKQGVGKRTMERSMAKSNGKTPTPKKPKSATKPKGESSELFAKLEQKLQPKPKGGEKTPVTLPDSTIEEARAWYVDKLMELEGEGALEAEVEILRQTVAARIQAEAA